MPPMPAWTALDLDRRADGVAVLTMNRPAVFNAFDEVLIAELDAAFMQLGEDACVRAVVLAGAVRHFSAGADLQWMQRAAAASQDDNLADARRFAAMLARSRIEDAEEYAIHDHEGFEGVTIREYAG